MKKRIIPALILALAAALWGCDGALLTTEPQETEVPTTVCDEVMEHGYIAASPDKEYVFPDNAPVFSLDNVFYSSPILIELKTATPAEIYYTTDGSDPDQNSLPYDPEEGIYIIPQVSDFPNALIFKARAYYPDGTVSAVSSHTYFCAENMDERFTTAVFVISADKSVLTGKPDGIFYGDNYKDRGDSSEREVYIECFSADDTRIFSQYSGIRIYGGASRESSIKSTKLYARKSYSSGIGKFHTDIFGTLDDTGSPITEYDKLVLRNAGNDFQFGFIRDELCQTLAMQAGYADYEAVTPAVVYLNSKYYGLFWLHESYCDDYFKNKYPNADAQGEFIIAEGTEQWKNEEEDGGDEAYAMEYNQLYSTYAWADLTDEATYAALCEKTDIENYLDYFAFNIYINNNDWPQNNYKCYRYVPAAGENLTGVYDGRWRYLLHDTDFSFGLYGSTETAANYNNIAKILDPSSNRYAPLFAGLMRRADCREYFLNKLTELSQGALSGENVTQTLYAMHTQRCTELDYLYKHMENLRKQGDSSFWTSAYTLAENMDMIRSFANTRDDYILPYAKAALEKLETEN